MSRNVIGIQIGATTSPGDLPSVVTEAEHLGFGEVWLAEDYFDLGGIASVSIALQATDTIPIGLGVVAAPARHPAVTAMEFATLGAAFPGRFMAGIGHGAPGWVRQMGLQPRSPMGLLREAAMAIRRLLDGDELTCDGEYFSFDEVRLSHPPHPRSPIFLGVQGPASLRLAGEVADGTLLGWFSSPSYVAWARAHIDEGRARAGRTDAHELVALCVLSISDDDSDPAHDAVADWATRNLSSMRESPQVTVSPARDDLLAAVAHAPSRPLPVHLLREFVAIGGPASCQATIGDLLEAGADRVVLVPNPAGLRSTAAMIEQMRVAAALNSGR